MFLSHTTQHTTAPPPSASPPRLPPISARCLCRCPCEVTKCISSKDAVISCAFSIVLCEKVLAACLDGRRLNEPTASSSVAAIF